ncbi:uncharacterized protein LOC143185545 [Calliopsis andreniformis]|uniref:uncharacterized protein LOC143185545 n=1 Tax=Calliopsis andreniformis TaxID=337506 RepID=UPI003FCEB640
MKKKHIDDVQPATVDEHLKVLLEDRSLLSTEFVKVTPDDLPEWFDEKLFKRGQEFQTQNILGFTTLCIAGLLAIISTPGTENVLIYTKRSSTPKAAFIRYVGTTLLTRVLYYNDIFSPNLKWFKAINLIRSKHAVNSKNHIKAGFHGIYQQDMAITQFGFMGFAFTAPESVGLAHRTREDLEGLNHFWRVTGYLLGISDRLNICRKTVEETTELCRKISTEIIAPYLEKPSQNWETMAFSILDGLWYGDFLVNRNALITLMYNLIGVKHSVPLSWFSYFNFKQREWTLYLCSVPYIGAVIRTYFNYLIAIMFWFNENYPLLAWIKWGKENAKVCPYSKM